MMAAEAGSEEGGSVSSAGTAGATATAGAEPGHYPAVCRGKGLGPQCPFPAGSGGGGGGSSPGAGPSGGPALCSVLGHLELGAGPAPPPPGGAATATGLGQGLEAARATDPGTTTAVFPPLPPPPPPLSGGLGTVDEGDSLDGPEYEEEEVAIPLNAPPTNQ